MLFPVCSYYVHALFNLIGSSHMWLFKLIKLAFPKSQTLAAFQELSGCVWLGLSFWTVPTETIFMITQCLLVLLYPFLNPSGLCSMRICSAKPFASNILLLPP